MTSKFRFLVPVLFALSAPVAWADNHCECGKACMESCAKGDTKACACKTCDCSEGKGCTHDKCEHHDGGHEHDSKAKPSAKPKAKS